MKQEITAIFLNLGSTLRILVNAELAYRPQLLVCDLCADTTGVALWITLEIAGLLSVPQNRKYRLKNE
jgi:hypothetical protein